MRWLICLNILGKNIYIISHTFREGNGVADKLASLGLSLTNFTWWYGVPNVAYKAYRRNLFDVTEFRISYYLVADCATPS